jgi:hypothetical protein
MIRGRLALTGDIERRKRPPFAAITAETGGLSVIGQKRSFSALLPSHGAAGAVATSVRHLFVRDGQLRKY